MSVVVLRSGFDWLETSYTGELTEDAVTRLDDAKLRARATDVGYPLDLFPSTVMVRPNAFGKWSWVARNPEFDMRLRRGDGPGVRASLRLSSFGLTNTEPNVLQTVAESALRQLGTLYPLTVSRADVCVDFQGWEPTQSDMANAVCRAKKRSTYGTSTDVQTFAYGMGGDIAFRLYNKTEEMKERDGTKDYFREAWRRTGRYDESLPVWRAEAEIKRGALKLLGLDTPEQVLSSAGPLLDYGLRFVQLRVPTEDRTKTRWPEDPRWTALRTATHTGAPLQRQMRVPELMDLDTVISRMLGFMATAGAYYDDTDPMRVLQRLAYSMEARIMRGEFDFPAAVELKKRRVLGG